MKFQITKVANGFMVTPAPEMSRDYLYSTAEIRVFATWQKASAWLFEPIESTEGD